MKSNLFFREFVVGPRKWSNFCWASVLLVGTIGFLITGLSSYFNNNNLFFKIFSFVKQDDGILFEPQGLLMCFYGIAGFFVSIYLWGMLLWNVGSGYNEFDRQKGILCLFRWGFPGKNRRIRIYCFLEDIKAIRIKTQKNVFSSYNVYIQFKNQQSIPLNQMENFGDLQQMENKAAEIAQFLQVPIEDV